MQIIFHVGPHKTGTKAIQHFLQRHVDFLRNSNTHVPKSLSSQAGHHEIPWALLGWDLRLIGSEIKGVSIDLYLEGVLRDAVTFGCRKIIFSSEDFSLLDLEHWKGLLERIELIAPKTEPIEFQIVSIYRNPDQYVLSQYNTLVLLGLSREFREVESEIKAHIIETHRRLRSLPTLFDKISEITELAYTPNNLMAVFWNSICPDVKIPEDHLQEIRVNSSPENQIIEEIRQGNLRAGLDFEKSRLLHWASFHTLTSATSMFERNKKIFTVQQSRLTERDSLLAERDSLLAERDSLLAERDSLLAERDSLLTSNSWKITRPLRFVGKMLRG
jgi:hypothetical protein